MVGWYSDATTTSKLAGYASQGAKQMLANGAAWFYGGQNYVITNYLNAAQALGMKVIIPVNGLALTDAQLTGLVNLVKDHPALVGYYIADEPESFSDVATIQRIYDLVKAADPNHPSMITFSGSPKSAYSGVVDMVGTDYYPAGVNDGSFGGQIPGSYDAWKGLQQYAVTYNKSTNTTIAVVQGTDLRGYRDMSDAEYRYHVFTAVVQGVKNILFWYDGGDWADSTMISHAGKMMVQIQAIGAEMNNGSSNAGLAAVSPSATNLAYRYGVNGSSGVVLAVNIANRSGGGSTLSDVSFTLPSGVRPASVTVLDESRTITVSNGVFTDSFTPFAVHVYKFTTSISSNGTCLSIGSNR